MNTLLKMRYENSLGKSVQRKVVKPDILIGVDYYWNLTELGLRKTLERLFLIPTRLGEVLLGKGDIGEESEKDEDNVLACCIKTEDIETFRDLETLGSKDSPVLNDDDKVLTHSHETSKFKSNCYSVN